MKLVEYFEPRSHLVIDDFFLPNDLSQVMTEVLSLETSMQVGLQGAGDNRYRDIKKNRNLWIPVGGKIGKKKYQISEISEKYLWHPGFQKILTARKNPAFHMLQFCKPRSIHVSSYKNGDHYGFHEDLNPPSNLTVVIFLCHEPKQFSGGNFVLSFNGEEKVIAFKHNRALIFPSNTLHKVTKVRTRSKKYVDSRFSLQMWPALEVIKSETKLAHGKKTQPKKADPDFKYYTPHFALDKEGVRYTEKFMQLVQFQRDWKSGAAEHLLAGVQATLNALTVNLKYITKAYFEDQRALFSTQLLKGDAPQSDFVRVICDIQDEGVGFSFGYVISSRKEQMKLELFVGIPSSGGKLIEKRVELSPDSSVDETVTHLRRLLAQERPTSVTQVTKKLLSRAA